MVNRFYSWPIRVHLIILVALLAVPSMALMLHSGIAERNGAIEDAKRECLKFVNSVASQQQATVAGAEQLATALALLPDVRARNREAATTLFSDLLKENPQYANIAIADKSGLVWASAVPLGGKVSAADRRFFQEAVRTGVFSSGEYSIGGIYKKPVVNFGYPVKNTANEVIAVIEVILDLNRTQNIFDKAGLPPGSSFSLLDHRGIILIRNLNNPFSEKLVGGRDTREEIFTKATEGPDEGTFEGMGNDGNFRLLAYKRISLPHESKPYMYIRSSIPLASAASKANAAMFKNLAVFTSLFLIGLFLAWFIGKRVVVNPIMMLKGASGQLAAGADTVNVSHVVKGGELGDLARSFDAMAEALVLRETAKNVAQAALRESEQRWAATLASIGDAIIAADVEGRITFMNAVAEELTGWALSEAAMKPVTAAFNIINEQTRKEVENPVAKVLREGIIVGLANHTILVRKDGAEVPIDDSGAPIRDAQGKTTGVVLVFRDITERKQAEEHTRHLASFPEKNPQPVIEVTSSGEVAFCNSATEKILENMGMDKGDCTAFLPLDLDAMLKEWDKTNLSTINREISLKGRVFGETIHLIPEFNVARIYARDITERKQAEEALHKAHDELELRVRERTEALRRQAELLELAYNAIFVRDLDSRITFWNTRAEELYGWTKAEALGNVTHAFLKTRFPVPAGQVMAALIQEGRWEGELVHTTKDGRQITVLSRQALQRDGAGNPLAIMEINLDITESRQLEAQLRQAQKMEALGTLSGGIAHDFNNILAAIIGFTELAAEHVDKGSRDERHLRRVIEASIRGRELVRQMLTFSRTTEQEKKTLLLSSIVKETSRLLRASTPTTIGIKTRVVSESGVILADPTQIQQVLMNLCTNAAYAMRERGGTLDIELSDYSVSYSNESNGMTPGLYMKLVVRDTGAGILPDIIGRIFDPFFTTKKPGEGTGLGLSVVHGIVKQSNGYITAESEPGRGSCFTVYFPKITGEAETESAGDDAIPTGDERILFVDDEEALVEMGEDILAELGYEVTSRMGSREALSLLKEDPSRFDLVITDQTMPDMTGVELAREMLALRPDMPIIMCTGFSHLVDAGGAKAAGIKAFAMKPLTKREIAKTIRKVLDG